MEDLSVTQNTPLSRAFATMIEASAAPYGYTITIWCSGALLFHYRRPLHPWEVFVFLAGAVLAFSLLGMAGRAVIGRVRPLPVGPARAWAGVLDWFAIGLSVGAVALIAQIPSWVAWLLAPFVATLIYLSAASIQLALVASEEEASGS